MLPSICRSSEFGTSSESAIVLEWRPPLLARSLSLWLRATNPAFVSFAYSLDEAILLSLITSQNDVSQGVSVRAPDASCPPSRNLVAMQVTPNDLMLRVTTNGKLYPSVSTIIRRFLRVLASTAAEDVKCSRCVATPYYPLYRSCLEVQPASYCVFVLP